MEFTHFDENGNALMVDVSEKAETKREATARGSIYMSPECLKKVKEGTMAKGDVPVSYTHLRWNSGTCWNGHLGEGVFHLQWHFHVLQ